MCACAVVNLGCFEQPLIIAVVPLRSSTEEMQASTIVVVFSVQELQRVLAVGVPWLICPIGTTFHCVENRERLYSNQ